MCVCVCLCVYNYLLLNIVDIIVNWMVRRHTGKNLAATILFVDFTKAFGSIHRGNIEQILLACGLTNETVAAIMILYRNTKVNVRSRYGDTEYVDIVARRGHASPIPLYHLSRLRA